MRVMRDDLDRRVVRLAIPALGTLAVEPLYVLVDTAIAGHLGTEVLAGLGLAAVILLTVTSLVDFMEYAATPVVAFLHGAARPDDARRAAGDAITLAGLLGTAVAGGVALAAPPLVHLLGGRGEVADNAVLYLRIMSIGLPFALVVLAGHGVMRGVNQLARPLVIVGVANALNLVLEIVAVYVLHWGIAGSAWSTVVAQALSAVWFLRVMRPHAVRMAPSWRRYKPFLVTGMHLGLRAAAMLAVWVTSAAVAARVDTPTLAANQVVSQLFMFLALALDALAIPAQSLVAGALGGDDVAGAVRVGDSATRLSLWAAVFVAVPLAALSPLIPHAFTSDGAVISRATAALLILAIMQFPGALAFALDGALIGANDERFLGKAAVLNLLGYLPLALLTVAAPQLGIVGLWGAQLMWITTRAGVNTRRWRGRRWTASRRGAAAAQTMTASSMHDGTMG
jgi:putative MATE family efflux protein